MNSGIFYDFMHAKNIKKRNACASLVCTIAASTEEIYSVLTWVDHLRSTNTWISKKNWRLTQTYELLPQAISWWPHAARSSSLPGMTIMSTTEHTVTHQTRWTWNPSSLLMALVCYLNNKLISISYDRHVYIPPLHYTYHSYLDLLIFLEPTPTYTQYSITGPFSPILFEL